MEARILIVDDEKMICSIFARRLNLEGYCCTMAYNGREGFNYFYKNTCGVVKESIRSPNFGNLSERKDLSMTMDLLKIGNWQLEIGN